MAKLTPATIINENAIDSNGIFRQPSLDNSIRLFKLEQIRHLLAQGEAKHGLDKCARRDKADDYSKDYHALDTFATYLEYLNGNASLWQAPTVPQIKLSQTQNSAFLALPHKLYATPSGRVVRRDAYQIGAPCTFARAPQASDQRVIRLALSNATNCNVNARDIASYCSGLMAVIKGIEKLGLAYEIAVYQPYKAVAWRFRTDATYCTLYWLKRANDCLSKHRFNSLVVCPDAMRRLWLELLERSKHAPSEHKAIGFANLTAGQQAWLNENFDLILPTIEEIGTDPQKLINWVIANWKLGAQNA